MVRSREGSGQSIFSQAWQHARALLALRWLTGSRSRWICAGRPWQPSARCGRAASSPKSSLHLTRHNEDYSSPFSYLLRPPVSVLRSLRVTNNCVGTVFQLTTRPWKETPRGNTSMFCEWSDCFLVGRFSSRPPMDMNSRSCLGFGDPSHPLCSSAPGA